MMAWGARAVPSPAKRLFFCVVLRVCVRACLRGVCSAGAGTPVDQAGPRHLIGVEVGAGGRKQRAVVPAVHVHREVERGQLEGGGVEGGGEGGGARRPAAQLAGRRRVGRVERVERVERVVRVVRVGRRWAYREMERRCGVVS